MSVSREEGKLARRKTGGPMLYFNVTLPEGAPQVVVGLLHGYAEYGARYAHVADAWAERGIATVAIDMRGHGHAEGPRGACLRFAEYLDDVAELGALIEDRLPGVPRVLFGHSFGGLVASTAVLANPAPWRALVLSSPFFGVALPVPSVQRGLGKIVSKLAPQVGMPSGLKGKDVTHDPARARAYDEDPLIFPKANVRWFNEAEAAQAAAIDRARGLVMPLYLFIGTADKIVKVDRARAFFDAAGSADKTWAPQVGLFHETLNEVAWRPIADGVAAWVLAHK
jgi:alpha-beta hydrolase superfamily lysophospholipase